MIETRTEPCKRGHDASEWKRYGRRQDWVCRACNREAKSRHYAAGRSHQPTKTTNFPNAALREAVKAKVARDPELTVSRIAFRLGRDERWLRRTLGMTPADGGITRAYMTEAQAVEIAGAIHLSPREIGL